MSRIDTASGKSESKSKGLLGHWKDRGPQGKMKMSYEEFGGKSWGKFGKGSALALEALMGIISPYSQAINQSTVILPIQSGAMNLSKDKTSKILVEDEMWFFSIVTENIHVYFRLRSRKCIDEQIYFFRFLTSASRLWLNQFFWLRFQFFQKFGAKVVAIFPGDSPSRLDKYLFKFGLIQ